MGLRNKIQAKVAAAFDKSLADAVNSFTGSYQTAGEVDPVTEESTATTVTYSGRGVLDSYKLSSIDNVNILHGDLLLIALKDEVTDAPSQGHVITTTDLVAGTSQTYKVESVQADPAAAHYEIQLRRA